MSRGALGFDVMLCCNVAVLLIGNLCVYQRAVSLDAE